MPKLIFTNAAPTTSDGGGMSVVFTYQVDGAEGDHQIHMVGQDKLQNASEEVQNETIQLLFAGALLVIETNWDRHNQLPDETKEYRQNDDFPTEDLTHIPWQGYELVL